MKHFFITLIILSFTWHCLAQASYVSRKEMTRETEKKWKRALNLSEKQYTSLKIINREFSQKTREIRMSVTLDYDDRMKELELIERERKQVLQTLFNEDQLKKLARLRGRVVSRKLGV